MGKNVVVHKSFEMGVAPYKYVGFWAMPSRALLEANPNAFNLAMQGKPACCSGCCNHCYTGILNHHIIADATGRKFSVGSTCIGKLNDTKLMTQFKFAEKNRKRDERFAKQKAEREARNLKVEEERAAQRVVNGGLTDYEVSEKIKADKEAVRVAKFSDAASELLCALGNQNGDFCRDLVRTIRRGSLPWGYAKNIAIEIIAKQSGRKNSKAYDAAYPIAEEYFEGLILTFKQIEEEL